MPKKYMRWRRLSKACCFALASASRSRHVTHALLDNLHDKGMSAQRGGQSEIDVRELCRQSVARRREVALDMDAGRQEIRQQNNAVRSRNDATCAPVIDIRLGKFEERCDDSEILSGLA